MVSLEAGTQGGNGHSGAAVARPESAVTDEGAAAPISVLSKLAFKDALLELEATVRKTRDVSSGAVLQLWQVAERRLGLEVDIEDPALRGLFGIHVVTVEELLNRVRAQAEATLAAVDLWSQPRFSLTAAGMRLLSDSESGDGSALGRAVGTDLAEADAEVAQAAVRLDARLRHEVLEAIDARLRRHAELREAVRDRQRWGGFAVAARRDVAWLRKESPGASGLQALSLRSSGPLEEAEVRLREASERVSELDGQLLTGLTELSEESVASVRRPWAALIQMQSEFFMAQVATWSPLVETFEDFSVA